MVGGRLDYVDNLPRAALIYRRCQQIINLFIAFCRAWQQLPVCEIRAGYNIVDWTKSGMAYWAVSSWMPPSFTEFVQLAREKSSVASTPRR